jgi:hypothetical protein
MSEKYSIIGLSFGTGKSNKYLAEIVEGISKEIKKDFIIIQKEIADWLPDEFLADCFIIEKHRQKGKYLDTLEVLRQAKEIINPNKKVIIVAQMDHWNRAYKIAKILGLEPMEKEAMKWYSDLDVPFDWRSKQWHTKCLLFYLMWELIARTYLWFHNAFTFKCPLRRECPYFQPGNTSCVAGDYENYCGYFKEYEQRKRKTAPSS